MDKHNAVLTALKTIYNKVNIKTTEEDQVMKAVETRQNTKSKIATDTSSTSLRASRRSTTSLIRPLLTQNSGSSLWSSSVQQNAGNTARDAPTTKTIHTTPGRCEGSK